VADPLSERAHRLSGGPFSEWPRTSGAEGMMLVPREMPWIRSRSLHSLRLHARCERVRNHQGNGEPRSG
jgi:hypothetical protein